MINNASAFSVCPPPLATLESDRRRSLSGESGAEHDSDKGVGLRAFANAQRSRQQGAPPPMSEAPRATPALDVNGVSHRYGARLALDAVTFSVAPASFTIL